MDQNQNQQPSAEVTNVQELLGEHELSEANETGPVQAPDGPKGEDAEIGAADLQRDSESDAPGRTDLEFQKFIEKYNAAPGGKVYMYDFKADLRKIPGDGKFAKQDEASIQVIERKVDDILKVNAYLRQLIGDYDNKLMNVIVRHEDDFLSAYKTHMSKVEKQLQLLKDKAKEQENKLNNDERIIRMEKQLLWYKDEFQNLLELKDKNDNEIDRVQSNIENLKEEKSYKEEQIKAQKRQNKLIAIALSKVAAQNDVLKEEEMEIQADMNLSIKESIQMPSLMISPFQLASMQQPAQGSPAEPFTPYTQNEATEEQSYQTSAQQKGIFKKTRGSNVDLVEELKDNSQDLSKENTTAAELQGWTNQPRDSMLTQDELLMRKQMLSREQLSSATGAVNGAGAAAGDSILKNYTKQLMSSGRMDKEIVGDLENYYHQLCTNCDQEILRLREELKLAEAEERTTMAEDLVLPMSDLDNLSNFFLDCVYAQKKSLRQKLIRMNFDDNQDPKQTKLLETYMKIVKTGAPEEIDQFSKIERQKLVELLSTNQDLLNFIFDKMFFNMQKKGEAGRNEETEEPVDKIYDFLQSDQYQGPPSRMSPAEMEIRNKQQQDWLNSTGKQSQPMMAGAGMFTAGIASGLASGLAYTKQGSSRGDDELKTEVAAATHPTSKTAPQSQNSRKNQRLRHIRANYPRPDMFIKNGKLVLNGKRSGLN